MDTVDTELLEEAFQAPSRRSANCFIGLSVVLSCLASLLLGYDISIMSSARLYVVKDFGMSVLQDGVIVSSVNFAAIGGAMLGGLLSDAIGRKRTVAVSSLVFIVGALVMASSQEFWSLLAGRLFTGLGVGLGLLIAPLYVAELSPSSVRGRLVSTTEITINVGLLFGYLVGFMLSLLQDKTIAWRLMLGFGAFPALALLLGVFFIEESPRWLAKEGRIQEAALVISKSSSSTEEVMQRLEDLLENAHSVEDQAGLFTYIKEAPAYLKRTLVIGVLIGFLQQITGIEAAVYYTPSILKSAGVEGNNAILGATVGVGASKLLFTVIASLMLDRFGRRPFLLISTAGLAVSLVILGLAFSLGPTSTASSAAAASAAPVLVINSTTSSSFRGIPSLSIIGQCLFVASFAFGWGPVCWVYIAETFPLHVRGRFVGVATLVNRLTSALIALTFLPLVHAMTNQGVFYMFASFSVATFLFVLFCVPETAGRTLEELEHSRRNSGWIVLSLCAKSDDTADFLLEETE